MLTLSYIASAVQNMYQQNKDSDAEHDRSVVSYIEKEPLEQEYRILKKTLTRSLWEKAKTRRTPHGADLWDCIKSGQLSSFYVSLFSFVCATQM